MSTAANVDEDLEKLTEELSVAWEELALVHGLTARLRPFTDVDRISSTLLQELVDSLGVRHAFIGLFDAAERLVARFHQVAPAARGPVDRATVESGTGWVISDKITRDALLTGAPLIVNDVESDPRFVPYPFRLRSLLTVPLKGGASRDRAFGVLSVADRLDGTGFTSGDLKLAATLAGLAAGALENALLVTDLQRLNTELQAANQRIVDQQASMVRAEKLSSLGRMAAGVAHELRNPLTVIVGRAQLLMMDLHQGRPPGAERLEKALELIETQAHRAERIISGLSTYARQRPPDLGEVHLAEVVEEVTELVGLQVNLRRVDVVVDVPRRLPALRGNRDQLMQVLINLIVNAAQAMPEEGGRVVVAAREERPGVVTLTVTDTGTGIPSEHLAKIFDPFFTTKPEGEGTGLGLSIIHGIVENHGGRIAVASTVGVGSTFELELPMAGAVGNVSAP